MRVKIGKRIFEEGEASAYATTMNTLGIGDPVPAANLSLGSGDKFDSPIGKTPIAKKRRTPKKSSKRKSKKD